MNMKASLARKRAGPHGKHPEQTLDWPYSGRYDCYKHASIVLVCNDARQNVFYEDRHMNEEPGQTTTLNTQDLHRSSGTLRPCRDMTEYVREKPGVVALWCLGIGFVLGWKLKPW